MRKKIKIFQFILFLLSIGLLLLSMEQYAHVSKTDKQMRARFEKNTISAGQLDEYYKQVRDMKPDRKEKSGSIPDVTLWRLEDEVAVTAQDFFHEDGFSVIQGYGNLEKILPGRRIEGSYPPKGDEQGCAISDEGAKALFGSSRVLGKAVNFGEKEYVVRGIIKDSRRMLWVQNPNAGGFPYVEMSYRNKTAASAAKEWLNQRGSGTPIAILAGGDYSAFNFLFLTLPVWALVIYICLEVKSQVRMVKQKYMRTALLIIWGMALIVVLFVGVRASFHFSLDYIPKRWSDFSFYGDKVKQLTESAQSIKELKPLPGDAELLLHSRYSAYLAWGSLGVMGGGIFVPALFKLLRESE